MKASVFHRLYHHRPLTDQQKEFLIYHYHPRLPFPFFPDTLTPDDLADVQLSLIDYAIGHLSADSATAKLMVSHPLLLGHHEAAMAELLKAFQRWQTSLHEILGVFSHPDMRISDALEDQLLKDLLADPIRFDERQAVAILSLLTQDRKMARMADEFFHHLIANRSLPSLWAANPGHFSDHWVGKVLLVLRRILPRLNSADRQYLLSTLKPIANGNRNEVQSDDRLGLSELLYRLEGPICRDNLF